MGLKFCATYPYFYPDVNRPYYEVVDECVEIAQVAEDLGFESISLPEHHFFNYICNPSALQFATLIAAKTKRIKILTGVLVLPYYHPLALKRSRWSTTSPAGGSRSGSRAAPTNTSSIGSGLIGTTVGRCTRSRSPS